MAELYKRHLKDCTHKDDRTYQRCDCPVWIQHERKRGSAKTGDWQAAIRPAATGLFDR